MARNRVLAVVRTALNAAALTGNYQAINPNGLEQPCFLIRIVNDSNTDVEVSYDGVTNHEYVVTNTVLQLPVQSNSQPNNNICLFGRGTRVYVLGAAGIGIIYLVGYYNEVT